ncbi:hypothetical protein VC83_04040 [Pseudogymnoascus destructans]|uniref:Uncharacterized protein n=1 Tax=Pseudogymnoascus destructans TaxID=655981 RepID=A0A177AER7_9PEZI|nr:uncharacterized protein VC83_04040 [Pseudogymnoascus destructans]OAF59751.1 hypothetical protein VC83_04040 [Pseudogymnoascus destructans]
MIPSPPCKFNDYNNIHCLKWYPTKKSVPPTPSSTTPQHPASPSSPALVATGASVRIYLIARKSSEERSRIFIQELHAINPKAEIIWTEGEISLLAETKRVCEVIKSRESRIDLLFLTTGYAPFGARNETAEGIEITQSLVYYSRILFIQHLLPLLSAAEAPKIVSVQGGGLERTTVDLDDMDLKKSGDFGVVKTHVQYVSMNSTS